MDFLNAVRSRCATDSFPCFANSSAIRTANRGQAGSLVNKLANSESKYDRAASKSPRRIDNSEYFARLVRSISDTIVSKREGIFEIDLRLRPYGNKGSLASSLKNFQDYFHRRSGALPYERQALIKLRAIGGDPSLGQQVEAIRDRFVYGPEPLDLAGLKGA